VKTGAGIFLLEDETLIRMMLVDMVTELGHRVVAEAANIEQGLKQAEVAEFDLAMLDVNLSGQNSAEIAEVVRRRGLPLLFVTGYTSNGLPPPFDQSSTLHKPFSIERLKQAIDLALNNGVS
jgi:CheY-like chemotaxis protein